MTAIAPPNNIIFMDEELLKKNLNDLRVMLDGAGDHPSKELIYCRTMLLDYSKNPKEYRSQLNGLMRILLEEVMKELIIEEALLLSLYSRATSKSTPILFLGPDQQTILRSSRTIRDSYLILSRLLPVLENLEKLKS